MNFILFAFLALSARAVALFFQESWFGVSVAYILGASAIGVLFVILSKRSARLLRRSAKKGGAKNKALVLFDLYAVLLACSSILFLPFVFDTFSAFNKEAGSLIAFVLTFVSLFALSFVVSLIRYPILLLTYCASLSSRKSKTFLPACAMSLILPFAELLTLLFFPLAYFGAMPVPFPSGKIAAVSKDFQISTDLPGLPDQSRALVVLVDPAFSDEDRLNAASALEENQLDSLLFLDDLFQNLQPQHGEKSLVMIWPETSLAARSSGISLLFSELEKRSLELKFDHFRLIAGMGSSAENVVIEVLRDPTFGRLKFIKRAQKNSGVPFFEKPVFGYSVFEDGAFDWSDLKVEKISRQPESGLYFSGQVLICYEALFPQKRDLSDAALVFTNHQLFSDYQLASMAYDYQLKLLATLLGQETILVANKGLSGYVQPAVWGSRKADKAFSNTRLMVWRGGEYLPRIN